MFRFLIIDKVFEVKAKTPYVESYLSYRFGQFNIGDSLYCTKDIFVIEEIENFEECEQIMLDKLVVDSDDYICMQGNKVIRILNYRNVIIYDEERGSIRFCIRDNMKKLVFIMSLEIYFLIQYFLFSQSIIILHGGCATVNKSNGTIFCGKSGSGKSTILLKLVENKEKFTNDDNVVLKIENDKLVAYKNTQWVGLDDKNLNENFWYLNNYVQPNIEFVEKSRIDYSLYDKDAYADKIYVKNIVWIESEHLEEAAIGELSAAELFCKLFDSITPYRRYGVCHITEQISRVISMCKTYKLVPSCSVEKTIKSIYKQII